MCADEKDEEEVGVQIVKKVFHHYIEFGYHEENNLNFKFELITGLRN